MKQKASIKLDKKNENKIILQVSSECWKLHLKLKGANIEKVIKLKWGNKESDTRQLKR